MIEESSVQTSTSLTLANGEPFAFAPGRRNSLLVDTLELLAPSHVPHALLLYMQDVTNKLFIYEHEILLGLGVPFAFHDQLADVLLYQKESNKLYFIYIVDSFGPVMQRRRDTMERWLRGCSAERVYVSVLFNRTDYSVYASFIAWGTYVWLAQIPNHIIYHM